MIQVKNVFLMAYRVGEDRYLFRFDRERVRDLQRRLAEYASRKDLNLTWYDAARISQKIRFQAQGES